MITIRAFGSGIREVVKEVITTHTMATYSQKHAALCRKSKDIMNDENKFLFDGILNRA